MIVVAAIYLPFYLVMGMLMSIGLKNPVLRWLVVPLWPVVLTGLGVVALLGVIFRGDEIPDGRWLEH